MYDTLSLQISNSNSSSHISSCYNYSWNGNIYNTSGTYYFSNGLCTDTLFLSIYDRTFSYDTVKACDSYNFINNLLTVDGDYVDTIQNMYGCDSIIYLNLSIISSTSSNTNLIACDSLEWNHNIYSSTGTYHDTLQNLVGCDSIAVLNLIMNYSSFSNIYIDACDTFTWIDGVSYSSSTDSIIYITTNSVGASIVVPIRIIQKV